MRGPGSTYASSWPLATRVMAYAAALCLEEAGAVVTDAYGKPIGGRPLLGSSAEFQISCVVAANQDLHREICTAIDAGVERLERTVGAAGSNR